MLEFDWDTENLQHIARHNVTAEEAESVLQGLTLDFGLQDWHQEERFSEAGATANGRILIVVTCLRDTKIRVVTASDAPKSVSEEYRKLMVS